MKTCKVKSSSLYSSNQCRLDAKYNGFVSGNAWKVFPEINNVQSISKVLRRDDIVKIKQGKLDKAVTLINISDQDAGSGRLKLSEENIVEEIGSDKNVLSDCDIMISKLGMPRGYIYLSPQKEERLIGSSELIPYTFKDKNAGKFYLYLFLMPELRNVYSCLETGKTPSHKRVNPDEFLKIQIPVFDERDIENAIEKIEIIEEKIVSSEERIRDINLIINDVFSSEFGFEKDLYNTFGKGMSYGTQQSEAKGMRISIVNSSELISSKGLRCSVRANNDKTKHLSNMLHKMKTLPIKNLLVEDIHRGCSPKYNPNGTVPVVKTAHLRNGEVLISDEEFVTQETYNAKEKAHVVEGDILLASTGKPSIGKIDLYEDSQELFADGHVSIIRIDPKKYNKKFFVYWFRCILGYFQIERDYVGCTNQVELYDAQIKEFLVPDIPLQMQEQIVKKVETKINEQMKIKTDILLYRSEIDKVIEGVIEKCR